MNSPLRFLSNAAVAGLAWLVLISVGFSEEPEASIPQSYNELWGDYDPRAETLDVEVLKEWEDDGVTLQVLRYHVGTFKGKAAKIAAVWGYPTGQVGLPGLVQIHGGGQFADANAVLTNARRGYATISLAWAGRISAEGYRVSSNEVQLFWDGATDDPRYKVTTDWGAVDGYHAPSRFKGTVFPSAKSHPWTIDQVDSARNSGWYLCAVAARRALTFLERQPQVDPKRLGVYGHSMGGKLTVMTAPDSRVKAAAPSCGGISDRNNDSEVFEKTLCDNVYLPQIRCPIMFLSPANDFHGRIDDLQTAVREIHSDDWRATCAPHHNHQDTSAYEVATQIWFDKHLKGTREIPKTPGCDFQFTQTSGRAMVNVSADVSQSIESVDVYYTRHGRMPNEPFDRDNTKARFWSHQAATRQGDEWTCAVDIEGNDRPLWVYANVTYRLDSPVTGAGYYYRTYHAKEYVLSSTMVIKTPAELKRAGVSEKMTRENVIEDFQGDWRREWFTYRENEWPRQTHKIYDRRWSAPDDQATLRIDVQSNQANSFVVGIDGYAAVVQLDGGNGFQKIELSSADFQSPSGKAMESWAGIRQLRLGHADRIRSKSGNKTFGGTWMGDPPKFKLLAWE